MSRNGGGFRDLFRQSKPLIAVCHLPPLPDYPHSPGIDAIRAHALADLALLERAGFDGILLENEHDRPHRVTAEPATVEAMHHLTAEAAMAARNVLVGCEILLNDPHASMAVCHGAGGRFIRTDYFVDRMMRPEYGEFDVNPDALIAFRREIKAQDVLILADIQVKYATMLDKRSLQESARLAALHHADAVVVTGRETGDAPSIGQLREARAGIAGSGRQVPVLIGSGLDADNAEELLAECDGAIVGTALMTGGRMDPAKLESLLEAVRAVRA